MKLGTLAQAVAAFSQALRKSNAPEHPAVLDEFVKLLSGRKEPSVESFLSAAEKVALPGSPSGGLTAGDLSPALASLSEFLVAIGKKDLAETVGDVESFLNGRTESPLAAWESGSVVSASRKKRKAGAAAVDQALVTDYLKKLDAALGKDAEFMDLYSRLKSDDRVTRTEAVEIADRFMGPVAASTSRPKALERVLHRHRKLMNFATGSASIGGRKSAA
jgi:hypothetical protein